MSTPKQPSPPDYSKLIQQGYKSQLKYAPEIANLETTLRGQQDPQRIQESLQNLATYDPTLFGLQQAGLQQLDPNWYAAHQQLGAGVQAAYARGTQQNLADIQQEGQAVRASQAARGNIIGNAPGSAEALYIGQRGQQLQQQNLANLGSYLSSPTTYQEANLLQGATPDRSSAYVNPQAGNQAAQFGLQNYANQYAAGMNQNPWANAFGGALGGATLGASIPGAGGYGALAGGLIGGVGGYFSDPKMKTEVKKVGHVPIYEYKYKAKYRVPGTFRGPMSTDVKKVAPGAVTRILGHDFIASPNSLGLTRVKVKPT